MSWVPQALVVLQVAILGYFIVVNGTYLVFGIVAFADLVNYRLRVWHGDLRRILSASAYRPISMLVPCYNERETIAANVRSLLTLNYPQVEIVVVNDGSTDDTIAVLRSAFRLVAAPAATRVQIPTRPVLAVYRSLDHPHLMVIDKENGGKSDALNAGLNAASYPLVCSIDADSVLESDALLRVARILHDDASVVAVGGIVRVLNGSLVEEGAVTETRVPSRWLERFQALEYIRGFLAGRRALAKMDSLLIISGAFGLFRKQPVIDVGGFSDATVCEDMELVVRLQRELRRRKRPGRVTFVPDPVCWTQVPSDLRSLLRQRDRWQRGLLESLWMHRGMFANPRYRGVGLIGLPYYTLVEALGPGIELLGYLLIPVLWFFGLLQVWFAVLFFLLAVLFGIVLSILSLLTDDLLFKRFSRPSDLLRLIAAAHLEFLGYRQLLVLRRSLSYLTVFLRRRHWGQVKRSRFVAPAKPATA